MMTKIRANLIILLFIVTTAGSLFALPTIASATPTSSTAATTTQSTCTTGFLTFPAWYRGLTNSDCSIKSPTDAGGLSDFIWIIVLNVIEILLQVITYIAFIMIIVGGFRFLTSAGNASGVEQGKKTLTNAIIGLVISLAAIAIVKLVFGLINGGTGN